ncbi:hypothetical protein LTR17_018056 [Elasticomyces elasticus]|nr:hypothetical protein LTR17_018056 [Elasticomyces elasticus]
MAPRSIVGLNGQALVLPTSKQLGAYESILNDPVATRASTGANQTGVLRKLQNYHVAFGFESAVRKQHAATYPRKENGIAKQYEDLSQQELDLLRPLQRWTSWSNIQDWVAGRTTIPSYDACFKGEIPVGTLKASLRHDTDRLVVASYRWDQNREVILLPDSNVPYLKFTVTATTPKGEIAAQNDLTDVHNLLGFHAHAEVRVLDFINFKQVGAEYPWSREVLKLGSTGHVDGQIAGYTASLYLLSGLPAAQT